MKEYPTPQLVISAPKEVIIKILLCSGKGINWANKKYGKLIQCVTETKYISLSAPRLSISIPTCILLYEALFTKLLTEIKTFVDSDDLPPTVNKNAELLMSIQGPGYITAVTILYEIGAIDNFLKPKQLVVFFGVDPAVNES